ncbi:TPA: glycosyltransferase family 2 protein, partial [Escherichia coli]
NKHKINDNLDYVLFLNPDVLIKHEVLVSFYKYIISKNIKASTIDLFKNEDFTKRDEFIRKFPTLTDFVSSIIFNINKTKIDRSKIIEPCEIDWCAGSFLCINLAIFRDIMGFDE